MSGRNEEFPQAVVREVDGELVLDDPQAMAVFRAVGKHNCQTTLSINADRVEHFKLRATELQKKPDEVVIVVLNVDDENGGVLADVLIPGTNWQEFRDRGEIPFARGLAFREAIQKFLDIVDQEAAVKLRDMTELAVVVVDHQVAEVFAA